MRFATPQERRVKLAAAAGASWSLLAPLPVLLLLFPDISASFALLLFRVFLEVCVENALCFFAFFSPLESTLCATFFFLSFFFFYYLKHPLFRNCWSLETNFHAYFKEFAAFR